MPTGLSMHKREPLHVAQPAAEARKKKKDEAAERKAVDPRATRSRVGKKQRVAMPTNWSISMSFAIKANKISCLSLSFFEYSSGLVVAPPFFFSRVCPARPLRIKQRIEIECSRKTKGLSHANVYRSIQECLEEGGKRRRMRVRVSEEKGVLGRRKKASTTPRVRLSFLQSVKINPLPPLARYPNPPPIDAARPNNWHCSHLISPSHPPPLQKMKSMMRIGQASQHR